MQIKITATGQEGHHIQLFPQTSFPVTGPTAEWLQANGCEEVPPEIYVPTEQDIINQLTYAVQMHLDSKARERNYDGILSACTYVSSSVTKFAAEAQACVAWRDACWSKCYAVMADVQDGKRQTPTAELLIAELPLLVW